MVKPIYKIIAARVLLLLALLVVVYFEGIRVGERSTSLPTTANASPKIIISASLQDDCQVQVKTTNKTILLPTSDINLTPHCQETNLTRGISPSRKYFAFSGASGGIDAKVQIYSVDYDQTFTLGVFGTSEIFDYLFLPTGPLALLKGYKVAGEQYLTIYNIDKAIKMHLESGKENAYLEETGQSVVVDLPESQGFYTNMHFHQDTLRVFGEKCNSPSYCADLLMILRPL